MRDGIEAGTGETEGLDAKRESPVTRKSPVTRSGTRPNPWFTTPNPILEGVELREAYARIREALEKWKCPSCGGAKTYMQRTGQNPGTIIPCKVCEETGLHPNAREALKATPLIGLSQGEGAKLSARLQHGVEQYGKMLTLEQRLGGGMGSGISVDRGDGERVSAPRNEDGPEALSLIRDLIAALSGPSLPETPEPIPFRSRSTRQSDMQLRAGLEEGLSLPGRDADGLLDAARDAEVEIRALREWIDDHVPSELIASEDWGKLHRPLVTRTVTKNLRAAIAAHEAALSTVQDGSVREEGWRDISSAPKDARKLILMWNDSPDLSPHWEIGRWREGKGWMNNYGHAFAGDPTHWMEPMLPDPAPQSGDKI